MQVVLYAEYERPKLLKFLQNSQYIILAQAQKELQERNLVPEIVYILERMGQIKKALNSKPEGSFRATFEDKVLKSDIVFLKAYLRKMNF